jgi:hypothetical protein
MVLEYSMQGSVLDGSWVLTDWVRWKTFCLGYEKRGYYLWNLVVSLGWKPGAIVQYLAC